MRPTLPDHSRAGQAVGRGGAAASELSMPASTRGRWSSQRLPTGQWLVRCLGLTAASAS